MFFVVGGAAAGWAIFSVWLQLVKNTKGHSSFPAIRDGHKVQNREKIQLNK